MTVFILGAGLMQVPAIDGAHELGWRVACADGNPDAAGARLADRFFPVDLKDLEGLERAALETRATMGLDAVFTAGTDFSAAVAWLADRLGLPGHPVEAARRASDKLAMREALARAGVPSPRFIAVGPGEDAAAAARAAGLSFPLVVKPADSMGARGCRAVRAGAELARAVAEALPYSRSARSIVEEYIEGPEFSLDALVIDGEVRIRGIADRHIAFAPYFVELGHTMPTTAEPAVVESVVAVFRAGIAALGLRRGAAKGDIKWCPARGSAVVGEIAARLSGGYMSGWTYPYASGLEPTKECLLLAAGLDPGPAPADRGWVSAERAWISIPGTCRTLSGLRAAAAAPFVKNVLPRAGGGQAFVFPRNNVEKAGNIISQAPDHASAIAAAEGAVRGILVRLEPADPATEAFLRGEGLEEGGGGLSWPPPAFTLPPVLAASLEALPERVILPRAALPEQPSAAPRGEGGVTEASAVLALPGAAEVPGRDWACRGFLESALLAIGLAGSGLIAAPPGIPAAPLDRAGTPEAAPRTDGATLLAGRFWRALARGGAQAALYVLDTEARGGASA